MNKINTFKMNKLVRLGAHPSPTKAGFMYDLRTITFDDWMLMIIRENVKALPKQLQKQYENKK